MGEIRDNVKRNLGYYLSLRGMSQKKLAEKLGVSQSAVTNWIKGKNSPDIEVVAQICDILGVTVTDLFGTDGSVRYNDMEKKVIREYRSKQDLRHAVNVLLGVDDSDGEGGGPDVC
jgi:transcriptional regulator with XRE-family HTH domain